jgi:hypothetical protein
MTEALHLLDALKLFEIKELLLMETYVSTLLHGSLLDLYCDTPVVALAVEEEIFRSE